MGCRSRLGPCRGFWGLGGQQKRRRGQEQGQQCGTGLGFHGGETIAGVGSDSITDSANRMKFLSILLASLWSGAASAAAMTFVHPGALDSREELDFVKAEIQAGAEPWSGEFERIRASRFASREPHPLAGIDSKTDDASVSRDDAIAAYTQALLWYYSGAQSYARGSIALLDSWAQLRGFTSGTEQDRLQAGWIGAVFAPAAEIMRGYSGWTPDRIGNLQAMFRRAFYPQLNTASPWNGNVDLTEIDAMLAIAVFNDDEAEFDRGLARLRVRSRAYFYLAADGARPRDRGRPRQLQEVLVQSLQVGRRPDPGDVPGQRAPCPVRAWVGAPCRRDRLASGLRRLRGEPGAVHSRHGVDGRPVSHGLHARCGGR